MVRPVQGSGPTAPRAVGTAASRRVEGFSDDPPVLHDVRPSHEHDADEQRTVLPLEPLDPPFIPARASVSVAYQSTEGGSSGSVFDPHTVLPFGRSGMEHSAGAGMPPTPRRRGLPRTSWPFLWTPSQSQRPSRSCPTPSASRDRTRCCGRQLHRRSFARGPYAGRSGALATSADRTRPGRSHRLRADETPAAELILRATAASVVIR